MNESTNMMTRRQFNQYAASTGLSTLIPLGCTTSSDAIGYDQLVAQTWRHGSGTIHDGQAQLKELIRYATLAANSHNTQPWRFQLDTDRIILQPDLERRCSAVDPDDHHLFASLGCAAENLILAAAAHGFSASVEHDANDAIRIDLEKTTPVDSPLFQAIPERQCTRASYDGQSVPLDHLALLEAAGQHENVAVRMFTGEHELESILEYVVAGNTAQMNDKAFVDELKQWLRFSRSTAVEHRDGLFSASSGNPTLPDWIGRIVFPFAFTTSGENDKYRDHIRSSAGVIAFISAQNDKAHWFEAGRCYQRFALQATALGLRNAFLNQAVEVTQVRQQFADYLGVGQSRPDLLVRFGYGPLLLRSLRRPLDQVIV